MEGEETPAAGAIGAVESAIETVEQTVTSVAQDATALPAEAAATVGDATADALTAIKDGLSGLTDRVVALEGTIGKAAIETTGAIEEPVNAGVSAVEDVAEPAPVPNPAAQEKSLLRKVHDIIG